MTTLIQVITLPIVILLMSAATLWAEPPHSSSSAAPSGTIVAVLDVASVFKNHHSFTQQLEDIKKNIEAFEAEVNRERQSITDRAKALEQYRAGSPEYKRLEEELAKRTSDIQVRAQLKRNEILDREATLYFHTYQEIVNVVSRVAEPHGISLVVKYDSEPIDPADRGKVLKGVNQFVILQRNLDLTNMVLQQVNQAQAVRSQ